MSVGADDDASGTAGAVEFGPSAEAVRHTLDRLVRRERGRLIAGLVARCGPARLELAEDVAQDAIVEALQAWAWRGLPENPGAWLQRVARNKAIDRLRREGREAPWSAADDPRTTGETEAMTGLGGAIDPELRLMVLCCHPVLRRAERLALTLKLSSGFTAREVASVLLVGEAAVGQRVARAQRKLRTAVEAAGAETLWQVPSTVFDLRPRQPELLRIVYLLFSLGYAPRSGDRLVHEDVCREALRLARRLAADRGTRGPDADALVALLAFQTARLAARRSEGGDGPVLLRLQNRARWDAGLHRLAFDHLERARAADWPSAYHLEAAIAGAHAAAPSWEATDWRAIRALYAALEATTGSPVVTVNAAVAQAMDGDPQGALRRLEVASADRRLRHFPLLDLARGEVLELLGRSEEAAAAWARAVKGGLSAPVRRHLERRLASSL